jgi:acyl-CoA thioesterase FadM
VKGFLLSGSGTVESDWIDKNGHMNVTAYMTLFDRGTDALLEKCGIGSVGADLTMVASRIMIDHRKELMEGEQWELWSGVAAVCPTYLTVTHRLRSTTSLRAVCDIRGTPFSMRTRAAVVMDERTLEEISGLIVPGLLDRFDPAPVSTQTGKHYGGA